ncbi:hypothetical protein FAY30_05475 [Bacillus sp. S3]|uniref:CBO0543 family protein n=1 Tax=Bacillus sp. S3 TaxID=486398 RepID=UPI00118BC966|nr:CBO0543 family protein [Bacillus sp. S3]QCJ41389.1 hypothetical protein FAY30_05475 [Bacillus sp. S3]
MSINNIVIILMLVIGLISIIFFIPKNRRRRFILSYLFCQSLTWISSMFHAQFDLLSFPAREFPYATDLLITTEYFFYPIICGFYINFEHKVNYFYRFFYLSIWVSFLTVIDGLIERYTDLIEYVHYAWYWTWLDFFCLFAISNYLYKRFFKDKSLFRSDKEITR